MRCFLLVAVVLLGACGQLGKPTGGSMDPPAVGNYCAASVKDACLGCDVRCLSSERASCRAGVTTRSAGNSEAVCTQAAVCQCR